jgi:hypothetical protein
VSDADEENVIERIEEAAQKAATELNDREAFRAVLSFRQPLAGLAARSSIVEPYTRRRAVC